jgi:hypothetical protein
MSRRFVVINGVRLVAYAYRSLRAARRKLREMAWEESLDPDDGTPCLSRQELDDLGESLEHDGFIVQEGEVGAYHAPRASGNPSRRGPWPPPDPQEDLGGVLVFRTVGRPDGAELSADQA